MRITAALAPLVALVAAAACDTRATASNSGPATPERPSAELESCGATADCAAGLRCFERTCVRDARSTLGDYLAAQLLELKSQYSVVDEVRGLGMLRGLAFNQPIGRPMYVACRENGLLTRPAPDWIGIAPPLVTTTEEADEIVDIVAKSLAEVTA